MCGDGSMGLRDQEWRGPRLAGLRERGLREAAWSPPLAARHTAIDFPRQPGPHGWNTYRFASVPRCVI